MLIQSLRDYAVENLADALADPAFEPQPVHRLILIDKGGRFQGFQETNGGSRKIGNKEYPLPKTFNIPKPAGARSSATESFPLLAVDSIAYVFGSGPWTKPGQESKEKRHHQSFISLIRSAQKSSQDEGLLACSLFYETPDGLEKAVKKLIELKKLPVTERFAFKLISDPQPLFQRSAVKDFWRAHALSQKQETLENQKEPIHCLCCARIAPIAKTHDKIKGIPGGQASGVSLISFDKDAFTSLDLDKGDNSAVCKDCAEAYVRGLNHILDRKGKPVRSDGTPTGAESVFQNGVVFSFWVKGAVSVSPLDILQEPTPEKVSQLFQARASGLSADATAFYAVSLTANGGRMVVRDWIETTLSNAQECLSAWFKDLEIQLGHPVKREGKIIREVGELSLPPGMYELGLATARSGDDVSPRTPIALLRAALLGQALPFSLLESCLRRLRVANDDFRFTAARVGLIRCLLNRQIKEGGLLMETALVRDCRDAGYVCGRLLAILGRLQYLALGDVGATVVDRFYGRASVAPQSVFGLLLKLARHHITKANSEWEGSGSNAQKEIEAVCSLLPRRADGTPDFPVRLDLASQGRFALGFYHQQAWQRVESDRRRQERETKTEATSVN